MDYSLCFYKGRYVYDAKEYLNAIRANFFNLTYDPRNRKKMIEEMDKIINFNSSTDLYALAHLLFDENDKYGITRCSCILDMIASWNYAPGKYLLAQLYYYGYGVEKDLNKFFTLSLEAAKENFIPAKNSLALAYLYGYGTTIDVKKGLSFLEECKKANFALGYHNIAYCYSSGSFGYPKDMKKAYEYYQVAANQFYAPACYNVAIMCLKGDGCSKNVSKGIEELIHSATLGHLKAQKKLGDVYYEGEIVSKDLDKAYNYYLMAAEQGDPYSMYSVGYMIVNNEKKSVSRYDGLDWLRKAAYAGNESAKNLLNKL